MRIAFIHPFLYRFPRGIERFLFRLANALAHLDVEVDILTWRWPAPIVIDTLPPNVHVKVLPTSRYFAAQCIIPFYAYHLLQGNYDFVWIFFGDYGEPESLLLASLLRKIPYGVTIHFPHDLVPHRYRGLRKYGCIKRARQIVVTTSFVAEGVQQAFARPSTVITPGVDVANFYPPSEGKRAIRDRLGLPPEDLIILTVAALECRKGIQHVLNALPLVRSKHPRLKYLVVGEGPYKSSLESLIRELSLSDIVQLVGSTTNVLLYYQAADLFTLLSHGESAGIAPLEALATELPVVLAAQRPFDEMISPECGTMVQEQEPSKVAHAILAYLANPDLRSNSGQVGRQWVSEKYSYDSIARRYLECSR